MGPRLIIAMLVISVVAMFIENTEACLTPSSTKNEILRKKRDTRDVQDGSNRVSTDGDSSRMAPDGLKQRDMTDVPPEDRDAAKDGSARGSTDARDSVILPGAKDGSERGLETVFLTDSGMKDGSNRGNTDGENTHVVPANGLKQRDMTDVPPEDRDTRPASRDAARGIRGMRPVVMDGEDRDIVFLTDSNVQDGSNRGDTDDTGMKDGSNRGNVDGENLHVVPANGLKQRDMTDVPPEDRDTRPASRDAARGVRGMRPVVMDGENRDIVDSMRNEARDADRLIRNGARMPM